MFVSLIVLLIVLLFIYSLAFTVPQQMMTPVERFGRFVRMASPGLNFKIPFIERVAGHINLRVSQLDVEVETKTKDNVFVSMMVSVQYFVRTERVYEAFYKLSNPREQITSFVFDVVRARVPKILLDDVFEKKDDIAVAVKQELSEVMEEFGYDIIKALVTDIAPDATVKEAMNAINAARRNREAATENGEAAKILKVKAAEAEAESKALEGRGIANQRTAIISGLRQSVHDFQEEISGVTSQDVMNLVLLTQYFDTLKEVGASSETNTILVPHSPGALGEIVGQLRNAMILSNEVGAQKEKKGKDKEDK